VILPKPSTAKKKIPIFYVRGRFRLPHLKSKNDQLRRVHNVSNDEMNMLSQVSLLGEIRSSRDLIYILNTVRHAVGK